MKKLVVIHLLVAVLISGCVPMENHWIDDCVCDYQDIGHWSIVTGVQSNITFCTSNAVFKEQIKSACQTGERLRINYTLHNLETFLCPGNAVIHRIEYTRDFFSPPEEMK